MVVTAGDPRHCKRSPSRSARSAFWTQSDPPCGPPTERVALPERGVTAKARAPTPAAAEFKGPGMLHAECSTTDNNGKLSLLYDLERVRELIRDSIRFIPTAIAPPEPAF